MSCRRRVALYLLFTISIFLWITNGIANAAPQVSPPQKNDHAQEAAIFERILNHVRFENDGTGVEDTEAVVQIQSQAGVEEFGQLVFGYSSATEKLEIE